MKFEDMHGTSQPTYQTSQDMVSDRYLAPPPYTSQPHSLSVTSYSRPPLADTSGNNYYKPIILPDLSHRPRSAYHGLEYSPPRYKPRPVPSQPTDLQRRRSYLREARFNPQSRGPRRGNVQDVRPSNETLKRLIKSSEEYGTYRKKCRDKKDATWPEELEDHFLEALLSVPTMGRVKYCIDKRPGGWGRNMIIGRYLDIAYFNRHGPRTRDQKEKARKQVSSHIQVLKQKMGHYPWFEWVIPSDKKLTKEEKDAESRRVKAKLAVDPCIAALKRGTLPNASHHVIRPWSFDLWMSTPTGACYNFTQPGSLVFEPRDNSENTVANLCQRFPKLQVRTNNAPDCDIVHIKACLNLHDPITEAELHGIFKISVPVEEAHLDWRCSVTFNKHQDLCGSPEDDPPINDYHVAMKPLDDKDPGVCGHLMRVHFPAIAWAHALSKLSAMHESWKEGRSEGRPSMSARQYLEQMTMYQEISCSNGHGHWEKRAIFAWTFEKSREDDTPNTWSYVSANPSRSEVFEPHPGRNHEVQAMMADNLHKLYQPQSNSLSIQPISFDCLSYGPTPPLTATSQPTYSQYQQSYPSQSDLIPDNGSFSTQSTSQNEDMLGEQNGQTYQLSNYLPTDETLSMSFEQANQLWQGQPQTTNYDGMDNFLPPLNMLPPLDGATSQGWDGSHDGMKQQQWTSHEGGYDYDLNNYGQAK